MRDQREPFFQTGEAIAKVSEFLVGGGMLIAKGSCQLMSNKTEGGQNDGREEYQGNRNKGSNSVAIVHGPDRI
jgi:hypothetical protein